MFTQEQENILAKLASQTPLSEKDEKFVDIQCQMSQVFKKACEDAKRNPGRGREKIIEQAPARPQSNAAQKIIKFNQRPKVPQILPNIEDTNGDSKEQQPTYSNSKANDEQKPQEPKQEPLTAKVDQRSIQQPMQQPAPQPALYEQRCQNALSFNREVFHTCLGYYNTQQSQDQYFKQEANKKEQQLQELIKRQKYQQLLSERQQQEKFNQLQRDLDRERQELEEMRKIKQQLEQRPRQSQIQGAQELVDQMIHSQQQRDRNANRYRELNSLGFNIE